MLARTAALLILWSLAHLLAAQTQPTTTKQSPNRVEKDLLGEKEIPGNAYYGVQTARALENFQLS